MFHVFTLRGVRRSVVKAQREPELSLYIYVCECTIPDSKLFIDMVTAMALFDSGCSESEFFIKMAAFKLV